MCDGPSRRAAPTDSFAPPGRRAGTEVLSHGFRVGRLRRRRFTRGYILRPRWGRFVQARGRTRGGCVARASPQGALTGLPVRRRAILALQPYLTACSHTRRPTPPHCGGLVHLGACSRHGSANPRAVRAFPLSGRGWPVARAEIQAGHVAQPPSAVWVSAGHGPGQPKRRTGPYHGAPGAAEAGRFHGSASTFPYP